MISICFFSAVSKQNGKIAEIVLSKQFNLELIGCYFSYIELSKHKDKLLKASKLSETELLEVMYQVLKRINFINEDSISNETFLKAFEMNHDIDEKDTVFVAMSKHLNYKIWSGDKLLVNGLRAKNFNDILLTDELLDLLRNK